MSHEIEVHLNKLPEVTGAGHYYVDGLWKHIDRKVPIHVMIFVLEGTFYVKEEGIPYEVPKHHMIILKANKQQTGYKYIKPGAHWLWVNFQDIELSDDDYEKIALSKIMSFASPYKFEMAMKSIIELNRRNEPYKQQQLNGHLYKLFLSMVAQSQMTSPKSSRKYLSPKVIDLLRDQLFDVFDTQAIAEQLAMNYSYISRKFREETGETVKNYYLTLKVNEAIRLFQSSAMNISEISDHLAFPNPYQFSRVFKKIKGISPSAYRKQVY